MIFTPLDIADLILITPRQHGDGRGMFMESYRKDKLDAAIGRCVDFVQGNQSLSARAGTVRGLHYQAAPYAQAKLVRCISGALIDIAVDARPDSPSFGQHAAVKLTAKKGEQLYIPEGFLHGFVTLTDNVAIAYKCSAYYSPDHDRAVHFASPALAIDWGVAPEDMTVSDKDCAAPHFSDVKFATS